MRKLLVIDAYKKNITIITEIIKTQIPGCKVLTAITGDEGIYLARSVQPDLIILDLDLPDLDGIEVCKGIRAAGETKHIPVIMITSVKNDLNSKIYDLNSGPDAFLSKPVVPRELAAQINVLLRLKDAEDKLRGKYENNLPAGMQGVIANITEQKETEKKLVNQEAWIRSIFRSAPIGIGVVTDRVIKQVNNCLCEITGYNPDELHNQSSMILYATQEEFERVGDLKYPDMKKMGMGTIETQFRRKDGKIIDILLSSTPIKADDWNAGITFTALDITERKEAEIKLLNALKKANESDRLKSAFLATMSHELRTPLNAIIGFSEFLDENIPGADVKNFGEIINSSGNHLLSIINDLFDITLIESGETVLRKDTANLKSLFNDVKNIIELKLNRDGKTDVGFYVELPKEIEGFQVIVDSNKLKQVLINLLKNAFKFTEKGSVTLGLKFENSGGKPILKINVTDTGIGIEKEKQEIIFDIFRQVEETTARRYGGTGIGLSVAKRLTEILGGRIWIESEIGKGSTFFVSIPYEEVKTAVRQTEDLLASSEGTNQTTVLVAEDDEPSFYLIKVILERLGIEIIWAKNGEEAVSYCKENDKIKLVLMDINMPVLNGYDATRKIKSFRPSLPVIAQTAYAVAGDEENSHRAGCDDYISKPIKQVTLLEKINLFLNIEN